MALLPPGIAHRDLKPENILCESLDQVSGEQPGWVQGVLPGGGVGTVG